MHLLSFKLCIFRNLVKKRYYWNTCKPPWNIIFFGSDNFSVYSLKALCEEYKSTELLSNIEVVTTIKGKPNPVQQFATEQCLPLHNWPVNIPKNQYHIGLVVSFGHLIPEQVINKFKYGILNVHASLLPRWRGAAPIIYAIANDDKETGISIMRIKPKHFDVGDIVLQSSVKITEDMKMPELHEKLAKLGAGKLVETLHNLPDNLSNAKPQSNENVTFAPKVKQEFAQIQWTKTAREIYNLERSLVGFLTPYTYWKELPVKLFDIKECEFKFSDETIQPGFVVFDKSYKNIKVFCGNRTWISVEKLGVLGKKIMSGVDFNNGYLKKEKSENRYFK